MRFHKEGAPAEADTPKRYGEPACKRATLEAFLVEA
jgi:hypothetical protein